MALAAGKDVLVPAPHPEEFRRRAVELARSRTKPVAELAKELRISESCLRNWMALWGSRSRPEPVTSGDRQPGMIAEVSLRLLYLIFSLLLSRPTLLGRASSARTSSSSFSATRSPYSAEPTRSRGWTGPTEPCSPP